MKSNNSQSDSSDKLDYSIFEGITLSEDFSDHKENSRALQFNVIRSSNLFLVLTVVAICVGAIGGIIAGIEFPGIDENGAKSAFNGLLMLAVWLGFTPFVIVLAAIRYHLRNQETIIELLHSINIAK